MQSSFKLISAGLLATTMLTAPVAVLAQSASPQPTETPPTAPAPPADSVDTIVVRGRFIPDEKRVTSEIANVITTQDIARQGDSDIAGALTRVTGLSLVGDGYVYVRGLGERYSSVLLDGSTLPSPEPLRRIVSLDIFPTALLAGTLVQKTYSVEYPAEFGGGIVALRSAAIPRESYLQIAGSLGYNTRTTLKRGNFADFGKNNWTGFSSSALDFPQALKANPALAGMTGAERQTAARSLRNAWSYDRETIAPDTGLRVTGGTAFDVGGMRAGVLGAVDYSSDFKVRDGTRRIFSVSDAGLAVNEDLSPEGCSEINSTVNARGCGVFRTNWNVSLNVLGAAGLQINDDHQLKLTSLLLRKTNQEARIEKGSFSESPGTVLSKQLSNFIEQQVWTNQLTGEHHFRLNGPMNDLTLNWRGSYAKANRDTPYRREFTYGADGQGVERWDLANGRNATIFSALEDTNKELGADGKLSGKLMGRDATFKFGAVTIDKDREFLQRRYQFDLQRNVACGVIPDATLRAVPEIITSPDNIGDVCGFTISSTSDNSDQFTASNKVSALYGSFEYLVVPEVRWTLGVRGEKSDQTISTFRQSPSGTPFVPVDVDLNAKFLLPATTVTWEFANGLQARAGYSQTLARPDLRELAPSQFYDVDTGTTESGNPALSITRIQNWDARIEWYFGNRRSATVGVFYKDLTNPIERTFYFTGEGPTRSLANAESAKLRGVEAEFNVALPIEKLVGEAFGVREFYLIGNATYIDSEVNRSPAEFPSVTKRGGALQGQSRYLANIQLGYDAPSMRERAALLLNYQSKRIYGVGILGVPNTIERPPLELDFTASKGWEVWGHVVELGFKAKNILGRGFKTTQGDQISEAYRLGTSFSLSLAATF